MWPFTESEFETKVRKDLELIKTDAKSLAIDIETLTEMFLSQSSLTAKVEAILSLSKSILLKVSTMAGELDALKAEVQELITNVAAEKDVIKAATLAIQGLTDQQTILTEKLQEAIDAGDPTEIQAVANLISDQNDEIIEQTAALAAAIPATPPPAEPA